jgi:hypothetical protein
MSSDSHVVLRVLAGGGRLGTKRDVTRGGCCTGARCRKRAVWRGVEVVGRVLNTTFSQLEARNCARLSWRPYFSYVREVCGDERASGRTRRDRDVREQQNRSMGALTTPQEQ